MEFRLLHTREDHALAARLTRSDAWVGDPDDAGQRVLGAFHDDELVGVIAARCWADRPFSPEYVEVFQTHRFATVVPRKQMAIITHVRVHPGHRGAGLSARLIAAMWRYLQGRDIALIFGDSQPHQLPWYRSLGMRPFGRPFNYPGGGIGVPMVGIPCDHDHMRRTWSVGLSLVRPDREDATLARRFAEILADNDPVTTLEANPVAYRRAIAAMIVDHAMPPGSPFSSLSIADRQWILERGYILECGRGAHLAAQHRAGRTVYIVLEGELQMRHGAWHSYLGRGEMCGGSLAASGDVYVSSKRATVLCLSDALVTLLGSSSAAGVAEPLSPAYRMAS